MSTKPLSDKEIDTLRDMIAAYRAATTFDPAAWCDHMERTMRTMLDIPTSPGEVGN